MRPDLVIFDCDGVLVESETISNRELALFLNEHGADLDGKTCHDLFAGTSRSRVEQYMVERGMPLAQGWSHAYYPRMLAALQNEVTAIDGVADMLNILHAAGLPLCVASNGLVEKMRVTLGKTGLMHHFAQAHYSAYDIGQSKPSPDVFLHAAQSHSAQTANCVVIEDSPTGFEAAARAGMPCLAYLPGAMLDRAILKGARPFSHMSQLPALLGV